MPRFCANISLLYPEVTLEQRLECALLNGFEGFEVQFPYELSVQRWQQLLRKYPIQNVLINVAADDLMVGGEGLACVPGKESKFREEIMQTQRYIDVMGATVVNVLPGRCLQPKIQGRYWGTFIENLHYAAEQFAAMGVMTTFEGINTKDMPGFLVHSTEQMLKVLNEVNHSSVKMQYDIYHMAEMEEDLLFDLSEYGQHIGHIQFADSPGRGEPGSGTLDLPVIFSHIDEIKYSGWVGAEYRPSRMTSETLSWFKKGG